MKKIRLSLRHFFQTQAEEESQTAPTETTTTLETTDETPTEEGNTESESTAEKSDSEETTPEASEDVMHVEMSEAAYKSLLADASSWRKYKSELANLRKWHTELVGQQVTPGADANSSTTGKKRSYEDAPWNR